MRKFFLLSTNDGGGGFFFPCFFLSFCFVFFITLGERDGIESERGYVERLLERGGVKERGSLERVFFGGLL